MSRIEPPRRLPLWIRLLFYVVRWREGRVYRPLQVAAHVPGFIVPLVMTSAFAHARGTLSPEIRLLAMQLIGELNGCAWCIDFGRSLAGPGSRDKILRVREFATHAAFSEAERAALRYAFESAQVPVAVSDETFAALRRHFTDRQIVELTYATAIESFFNRVNSPLGIEAEGFCALPAAPHSQAA